MNPSILSSAIHCTRILDLLRSSLILCIAIGIGFYKRAQKKLSPGDFVQLMVIASFQSSPWCLKQMASALEDINPLTEISSQGLSERINSPGSQQLMKHVLAHTLQIKIEELPAYKELSPELLSSFNMVALEDSSKIELHESLRGLFVGQGGDASKSALKMHTVYDLISKRFLVMDEHSGKTSDKVLCKKVLGFIKKGNLLIRDLGFFYTEQLKCIKEIGAFYLSRLPANVLIRLELNGKPISFGLLFKNKSLDGSTLDLDVFIGEERFPTRLVAYRVPDQVANQRRRDLNKDAKHRGTTTQQETKDRQDFSIFITNVSRDIWPPKIVQTVYRLRWQIELIYKSWKSQLKIHFLRGKNEHRIRTLLYAKWLAIILCFSIYSLVFNVAKIDLNREVSLHKFVNWLLIGNRFETIVKQGLSKKLYDKLLKELSLCCKDKRIKCKSSLERVFSESELYAETAIKKS